MAASAMSPGLYSFLDDMEKDSNHTCGEMFDVGSCQIDVMDEAAASGDLELDKFPRYTDNM